jgi:hypothetical protein
LIDEASGIGLPAGYSRRFPGAVDPVTVVFRTSEVAFDGIPHCPAIGITRSVLANSAGPP